MAAPPFLCCSRSRLHAAEKASPLFSPTMSKPLPVDCPLLSQMAVEQLLAAIPRVHLVVVELPSAIFPPYFPAPATLPPYRQFTMTLRRRLLLRAMVRRLDLSGAGGVGVPAFF